ncbi:PREDICTED: uncharacterized protein LOC105457897 isoform X2 [Wasmannia auropunctata]|uniref:uncharacterized protein LOC105457897 isoform X2 n=1 Tax=Wasmannia auropunctata TaxID=64793 RepID=UPI0005ED57B2|nr:PREDICTED: uncharacterized protein LOC105457897 isoform X2 [Wasmannia auropunctata]
MKYSSRRGQIRVKTGSSNVRRERIVHRHGDTRQAGTTEIVARCRGCRGHLGHDHAAIPECGAASLRDGNGDRTGGGSAAAAQDAVHSGKRCAISLVGAERFFCLRAQQTNNTSSSFHTPDSRESNATISMVSDIESFAEETNISEHRDATESVEMQFMVHDIHAKQADLSQHCSEQSIQCEKKRPSQGYHLNSSRGVDGVVQHFKTSSMDKYHNSHGKSDTNVKNNADKAIGSIERLIEAAGETNSLEGWTKMTDNVLCEYHDDPEDDNALEIRSNVDRNVIDNHSLTVNNDDKCDEIDDKKVSVEKCSAATVNRRSPLTILEEYAKRCKVSIKYEYKPKLNSYVINGDLCGFRAMSCAATREQAKNELAAKILWMIAERQMDGMKLSSPGCGLLDFSRDEMLEITAINKNELKNASQKLYKFCLEKGKSIPEYTIRHSRTNQGFMYTAQCVALGHVEVGQGLRKDSARIAAAESLYQKYIREAEQQSI